jgi:O-antigen ligase
LRQRILCASGLRACEVLTEGLLYFVIVFTPWAFGTTQPWAIRTASAACYALGLLLGVKWVLRRLGQVAPVRWMPHPSDASGSAVSPGAWPGRWVVRLLAALTVLLLAFCLISALNPRAVYDHSTHVLHNLTCRLWLPHSYDPVITWMVFWQYLAVACLFWSCRDWLLGKTREDLNLEWIQSAEHNAMSGREIQTRDHEANTQEDRGPVGATAETGLRNPESGNAVRMASHEPRPSFASDHEHGLRFPRKSFVFPARLKRLLWVVSINGALLAAEGIIQRLDGTDKLLWVVQPRLNALAIGQFGPYAYRSNAAQYLNLVWPVSVGFWLALRRHYRHAIPGPHASFGRGSETVLLPMIALMTAAPVVSSSRGGVLVALVLWVACGLLIYRELRRDHRWARLAVGAMFIGGLGLGAYLGGAQLGARMRTILDKDPSIENRQLIYENARTMAEEHPWFGTGPGTFSTLYQFYRDDPNKEWAVMAHNDWLETRVTFGRIGSALIGAVLLLIGLKWFIPGGLPMAGALATAIGISLGGCLLHAIFDFPLQILSILLLFALLCSVLFSATRGLARPR